MRHRTNLYPYSVLTISMVLDAYEADLRNAGATIVNTNESPPRIMVEYSGSSAALLKWASEDYRVLDEISGDDGHKIALEPL